jgi:Fe-S cluster biogenesis protein NfuA
VTRLEDGEVRERVARVDALLDRIDGLQNPAARTAAVEALQGLLDLYGEGLARILDTAARLAGSPMIDALAGDELVSHLLLLHDLHPLDLETRVRQALEAARPYLESHGAGVELLGVPGGIARLRLHGACGSCGSSARALRTTIEQALEQAAPDLAGIETVEDAAQAVGTFVPLASLGAAS